MIFCGLWTIINRSSLFFLICLLHSTPLGTRFYYLDWQNDLESEEMFLLGLNRTCHLVVSLSITMALILPPTISNMEFHKVLSSAQFSICFILPLWLMTLSYMCLLRRPDSLPKDTLPKDILPNGHFADGRFANGHFADGRFAERTFCRTESLPNGHFTERTVCRK